MLWTLEEKLTQYTVGEQGCWLWARSRNVHGYGQVRHKGAPRGAHRVSYEHHIGPIPAGLFVLHRCDQRACINPDHLYVGTPQDNADDMHRRGRGRAGGVRGEANTQAKLTEAAVIAIRGLRGRGLTQKAIGDMFGVARRTVGAILSGTHWRHVS